MKDILYLLGYPFGFTQQCYYQIVNGIKGGTSEGVNKGEFLNIASLKCPYTEIHYDLICKHNNNDNKYWCEDNKRLKMEFCRQVNDCSSKFFVFRDTVEPKIMYDFLSSIDNPKGIIIDLDEDYLVNNMNKHKVYFPTNLVGYEESVNSLRRAITKAKDMYRKLSDDNKNIEILDLDDFIKYPTRILDIVSSFGFEVDKKNYLGKNINSIRKKYK